MQRSIDTADVENLLEAIAGFVKDPYDYVGLSYVAAGNGAGELEVATFRNGGSLGIVVATVTITYDANDRVSSITAT